jgi:hypothetical protein
MAALADRPPPSRLVSPYPPAPATSVAQIGDLLRRLAVASLKYSPLTARFYAERALSLQPLSEPATCLLAQCHLALGSPHEALWLLRQPVAFTPVTSGGTSKQPRATTSSGRLILPANECSLRCARLYAEACRALRRDQEGRQVLAQVNRPGVALAAVLPLEGPPSNAQGVLATVADEPAEVELELARLAQRAGETDRAIVGYRKVLSRCPTCWEALEALCSLGEPPDVETLLPTSTTTIRPRSFPRESVPVASVGADHLSSASQTGPQPLTPSQNVVVNAPADYVHATRLRGDSHGPGLVTPIEVPLKPSGGVGWEVKGKGRDAAGAPPPLRRVNPGNYVGSRSTNEQDEYVHQQLTVSVLETLLIQVAAPVLSTRRSILQPGHCPSLRSPTRLPASRRTIQPCRRCRPLDYDRRPPASSARVRGPLLRLRHICPTRSVRRATTIRSESVSHRGAPPAATAKPVDPTRQRPERPVGPAESRMPCRRRMRGAFR